MTIDTIILAAGPSLRLGQPKQLLELNGESLIRRAIKTALSLKSGTVHVILGANQEKIEPTIQDLNCMIYHHVDWQLGVVSSYVFALKQLKEKIDGVLVLPVDKPFIKSADLLDFIANYKEEPRIILTKTNSTPDNPAFISHHFFEEMKSILTYYDLVKYVRSQEKYYRILHIPESNINIDNQSDLRYLERFD